MDLKELEKLRNEYYSKFELSGNQEDLEKWYYYNDLILKELLKNNIDFQK